MNFPTRPFLSLLLAVTPALLLSGCGGGGGGSSSGPSTYYGSISGKIVDTSGSPVPTAVISLDSIELGGSAVGGTTATLAGGASFSEGGYEIQNASPGFHEIEVSSTVNGTTYTGSTQVGLPNIPDNALTNANIIVSPSNEQATVSGYVTINNQPVGGAVVYFQSTFATPTTVGNATPTETSAVSLQAITASNGYYQITNLPVLNGTSARSYTVTASYPTGSASTAVADATPVTETFTAGENDTSLDFSLPGTTVNSSVTPTLNYIQAFTQPDIPSSYTPAAVSASQSSSVYDQIRADLSPQFAKLTPAERTSAVIKHLVSVPHATAGEYTIEMDLFFSLPGDSGNSPSPARSSLSGFQIDSDALSSSNLLKPYDFLQDPLANFYTDPDLNVNQVYYADTDYQFAVQSVASDGVTLLGSPSNTDTIEPLAFVNVSEPLDPSDNNGSVASMASGSDFEWTTIDPRSPSSPNFNVADYYVYIYSTFPGVTTTPVYTSAAIAPNGTTVQTAPVPNSLTVGDQYWLVVAATSTNDSSTGSAISVSQILPFTYGS